MELNIVTRPPLLGIKLMPRIRNWKDLKFFRPDKHTHYKHIDHLFKDVIDWRLIETHWKDLFQVVVSIKMGKILPSTLLRKLSSNSKKNRLYQAFRKLGRVIRTIFLLQYISDMKLQLAPIKSKPIMVFRNGCFLEAMVLLRKMIQSNRKNVLNTMI
ncbi:putative transposase [Bacillus mycoides NBRC 101238 = DSM 11821]|nr:Tn5044 transposase [Bacillus cereus BDRD-ST196]GAE42737.1 putative transposase [Bacillus mycoides NBRC 101238 = DSM 11821]